MTKIDNKNHNFPKAGDDSSETRRKKITLPVALNHELVLLTFGTFQSRGSNHYPQLVNWMELAWTRLV
jgi:hypothetical protein